MDKVTTKMTRPTILNGNNLAFLCTGRKLKKENRDNVYVVMFAEDTSKYYLVDINYGNSYYSKGLTIQELADAINEEGKFILA